jgi:hypothetical protein
MGFGTHDRQHFIHDLGRVEIRGDFHPCKLGLSHEHVVARDEQVEFSIRKGGPLRFDRALMMTRRTMIVRQPLNDEHGLTRRLVVADNRLYRQFSR